MPRIIPTTSTRCARHEPVACRLAGELAVFLLQRVRSDLRRRQFIHQSAFLFIDAQHVGRCSLDLRKLFLRRGLIPLQR